MGSCEFRIVYLYTPRSPLEFTGFVDADVLVYPEKRKMRFRGILPCCFPYFVFSVPKCVVTHDLISKKSEKDLFQTQIIESVFDHISLTYMYEQDMIGVPVHMLEPYLRQNLNVLKNMDAKATFNIISRIPAFHKGLQEFTNFYKFKLKWEIMTMYNDLNVKQDKVEKAMNVLSYEKLCEFRRVLAEDPIQLCFTENGFIKYPLSYNALRSTGVKYSAFEFEVVRLINHFRRDVVGRRKFTAIHKENGLTASFFGHKNIAATTKDLYNRYLQYLAKKREIVCMPYICTPSQKRMADATVQLIKGVLHRGYSTDSAKLLRVPGDVFPIIPRVLTEEQTLAAEHILNSPLTMVMGAPGRGKTALVEFVTAYFRNVCTVSFIGTVVAMHRSRLGKRQEVSNTAHHVFRSANNSEQGMTWAAEFEVLVWDEFSNVKLGLLYKLLSVLPNLKKIVLVFDPNQIPPIAPSAPAMDLRDYFPQHAFTLTRNLRVNPNARELADAIMHILHERLHQIEWSENIKECKSMTVYDTEVCEQTITHLLTHIMNHPAIYKVETVSDIQFIAFTNDVRKDVNVIVETVARKVGLVPRVLQESIYKVHGGLSIYPGCKIGIKGANFKPVYVDDEILYDEIRNGETGIVDSWHPHPESGGVIVKLNIGYDDQKTMLLKKGVHVDPAYIGLGHVITSDSSQALEFNTVIGLFCGRIDWVRRERAYVMTSRAREAFIAMGPNAKKTFNKICKYPEERRVTVFGKSSLTYLDSFDTSGYPEFPRVAIRDPREFTVTHDKTRPCVPVKNKKN